MYVYHWDNRKTYEMEPGCTLWIASSLDPGRFAYRLSPSSVIRFYYGIIQHINIGDGGVISGVPCATPCVFGIGSGETRFEEVPPLLEQNGIACNKCFTEPNVSWTIISCGMARFNVQADTSTNLVNGIWFIPNVTIRLGEFLKKYGEPDYISLSRESTLEGTTVQARLYWDGIRMLVLLPICEGELYPIDEAAEVEGVSLSDEILYQDSSEVEFGSIYQHWNGYGTYQP
jgi:hypothetical protein